VETTNQNQSPWRAVVATSILNPMRRLAIAAIAVSAFALAACGSSPSSSTTAPSTAPAVALASGVPVSSGPCTLKPQRDLLIWEKSPTLPAIATRVGDVDIVHCAPTLQTWIEGQPAGAGYCSKIAWADDNPGYDENASPATALKEVIDQTGPAC
jgi:hypothetical protein